MEVKWQEWNKGQKMIFASSCLAALSLFLPWADIGIATSNGFSQGGFLLLALFVYPLLRILKSELVVKKWGIITSVAAIFLSIIFAFSKTGQFMGKTFNASGSGLILFIICSVVLFFGVKQTLTLQKTNSVEDQALDNS